jgi:RNA polymerase sigma-70 factor (ECF subfamily)
MSGEPEAVDEWFRAEHPEVYRLCAGFLADATEAEDLAQDAMLKLLDNLSAWDRRRGWRAWRNTLVLNLCRDRLRRIVARRGAELRSGDARHAMLPARLPDPLSAAQQSEVRDILMAALTELTPREREVFVLRDLEGNTTAESAVALGVGESTVRSLLTLARRRLRALLGERVPELVPGGGHD